MARIDLAPAVEAGTDGDGPMLGCAVTTVLTKKGHT
jgi:hypothetical protein